MSNEKIDMGNGIFINISLGNSKMGKVFSFSMPAIITCASCTDFEQENDTEE